MSNETRTDGCHMTKNLGSIDTDPVEGRVREDIARSEFLSTYTFVKYDCLHVVPVEMTISSAINGHDTKIIRTKRVSA